MKKWLMFICCCFMLMACSKEEVSNEVVYPEAFEAESDNFRYELYVSNNTFAQGEPFDITATLTYIGDQDEIVISHAASPFYFPMTETTRGYNIDYPMHEPLIYTTLKKDEPLTKQYVPSGSYSDTDEVEYVAFMKEFLAGDYPVGNYIVNGSVQFNVDNSPVNINGNIGFRIQ